MDDRIRPALYRLIFVEDPRFSWREQAIEAPQHGQRQDHLAVFVPLIGAAEQVADAPDEVGELGMGFRAHEVNGFGETARPAERDQQAMINLLPRAQRARTQAQSIRLWP